MGTERYNRHADKSACFDVIERDFPKLKLCSKSKINDLTLIAG
jgi:hypothetical protein